LKKLQLEIHQVFIDMVKASRGDRLKETDETFTGAFWTGYEGKELGLVDDIGDMRSVLKEKFGEKTTLKLISAKRGLFGGKSAPGISMLASSFASGHASGNIGADISQGFAQGIASTVEERALWAQYGL
jgi:ClpP class serine protease